MLTFETNIKEASSTRDKTTMETQALAPQIEELVYDVLRGEKEELFSEISLPLWNRPELGFEETYAHKLLTDFLERKGFKVDRNYHLPTAFRAEYGWLTEPSFTVCVICEYDALPDIGHACGHNLIATAGVGAALAIKTAVDFEEIKAKLVVMGTPAEESGGGKSILIEAGAFDDIDFAMMVHPGPYDVIAPLLLAVERLNFQFFGREAHASMAPWEGVNALDAAVLCYTSIGLFRQHMKPNCKVHGIISKGGTRPNVVPAETELKYYVRAPDKENLDILKKTTIQSAQSAATATGCSLNYNIQPHGYDGFRYVTTLQAIYRKYAEKLGVKFEEIHTGTFSGSTDMGNVSQVVPSIHPVFSIKTTAANHTKDFAEAAATDSAKPPTIIAAICMALTAIEILYTPSLQKQLIDLKCKSIK